MDPLPVTPLHIHTWSPYSGLMSQAVTAPLGISGQSWPSANRAFFYPIVLPFPYTVRRMFWLNSTGTTLDRDVGIYTEDGAALYTSGATAASGANAMQYVTLGTPLTLSPGRYYLACAVSNTNANCGLQGQTSVTTAMRHIGGVLELNSAYPLPADASAWTGSGTGYNAYLGITSTDSGF